MIMDRVVEMMMMKKKQDYGWCDYEKIIRESPVPKKGHFVVYVGNDHRRFVVPLTYLKSSIFRELLDEAAADDQERGSFKNGIVLPNCDVLTFQRVSRLLASKKGIFSL